MDNTEIENRMKIAQKYRIEMIDKVGRWIFSCVCIACLTTVVVAFVSH
jgi:branched-subunit amino acid permease